MFICRVVGTVVSTIKHPSYEGTKLLLVRETDPEGNLLKRHILAVDTTGAGVGDWVLVASEGLAASELLGLEAPIPIREVIVGIIDRVEMRRREA